MALDKVIIINILIIITLISTTGSLFFQNQKLKNDLTNLENKLQSKSKEQNYYYGQKDEVIAESNNWQLISTKGSDLDYFRGLYLKNTEDPNKLKILGTTDPFLFDLSAIFLNKGDTVLFIQTAISEEKRLYPQKEKIVFYSISQDKVFKEILKEKFLEILTEEEESFARRNYILGNLKLSPDEKHVALNVTNLMEPSGWIIILNLQNGKITKGPQGVDHKWTDERTIEYQTKTHIPDDTGGQSRFETKTFVF